MIASWVNSLPLTAEEACEDMHPKRGMWVRFIRDLRLVEYSKKDGYKKLAAILDCFFHHNYKGFNSRLEYAIKNNMDNVLPLISMRPSEYTQHLFWIALLHKGGDGFRPYMKICGKTPLRMLYNLYIICQEKAVPFASQCRKVTLPIWYWRLIPLARGLVKIGVRNNYKDLNDIKGKKVWIDKRLFSMPMPVYHRSSVIHDLDDTWPGTILPVKGNHIRLFTLTDSDNNGEDSMVCLNAILYHRDHKHTVFGNSDLTREGAVYSGTAKSWSEVASAANYLDLDIDALDKEGIEYVAFYVHSFLPGGIPGNTIVGWMNATKKLKVDPYTGMAYDPSAVRHFVRIDSSEMKNNLVFGILRIETRDIVSLDFSREDYGIPSLYYEDIKIQLRRLSTDMTVGKALDFMFNAQNSIPVENEEAADVKFTYQWARNHAQVARYLLTNTSSKDTFLKRIIKKLSL